MPGKGRVTPIRPCILKYVKRRYDPNAAAFIVDQNGKPYTGSRFRETVYYPALEAAGVTKHVPHCTRHTFATALIRKGVDPSMVKYLMGHTNYAFTVDTYGHNNFLEDARAEISQT